MPAKKKRAAAKPAKRKPASKVAKKKAAPKAAAKAKPRAATKRIAKPNRKPAPKAAAKPAKAVAKAAKLVKAKSAGPEWNEAVEAFMRGFAHPMKAEIQAIRERILGLDPAVREAIKWNAPSFLTADDFATFNFFAPQGFRLILHTGATKKELPPRGLKIDDPAGLLQWQGRDRAMIHLRTAQEAQERMDALESVVRQWLETIEELPNVG